jgi:hypothetical protein
VEFTKQIFYSAYDTWRRRKRGRKEVVKVVDRDRVEGSGQIEQRQQCFPLRTKYQQVLSELPSLPNEEE